MTGSTKEEVSARLFSVFRRRGYDGASVTELSAATGLGRSGLYHHFPGGKDDMALAVLDHVRMRIAREVIEPLSSDEPPRARLKTALQALDALHDGGREPCVLGALVLSGPRPSFSQALRTTFELLLEAFAKLAVEAGADKQHARRAAEDAVLRIQGSLILAEALGDPGPFQRAIRRIPDDLLPRL